MYNPLPHLPQKFQAFIEKLKSLKIHPKIIFFVLGILSTLWFLIRVIPKPSRASYPCMQATAPFMAAFIIWLSSLLSSAYFLLRIKKNLNANKYSYTLLFMVLFAISILIQTTSFSLEQLFAQSHKYNLVEWNGSNRANQNKGNMSLLIDTVSIVRSEETTVYDLDIDDIEILVREAVELSGGIAHIIQNGDYVVLKPNLVGMPPIEDPQYAELSGMTTDWRVVKAMAKMVREINPDGLIYIIESSAAESTREVLDFYHYTMDNFPEVNQIIALEESCGAYEDYEDENLLPLLLPDSIALYPDEEKPNLSPEFYMNKIYYQADVVISIPVLKNHKQAIITGGIKNVAIGMAPPNIYGMSETFFGKWTKINHAPGYLSKWIHDFYLLKPVDYVLIDGLQGFDHGPSGDDDLSMEEMQHNMRLIIAGEHPLSVDGVCAHIMSLDPTYSNYMVYLDQMEYEVGTIDPQFIRIIGQDIPEIRELFPHTTEVVNQAIYSDYTAPVFEATFPVISENQISFDLSFDEDLNKVEFLINGQKLDQVCIGEFDQITLDVAEEIFPVEELVIIGYDRFYNNSEQSFLNISIEDMPRKTDLSFKNYPNPFIESTHIEFELTKPSKVKLYISDMNSRLIEILDDSQLSSGPHQYLWKPTVPSGIYICTLEIEGIKISQQLIKQ